jgi:hypothetical protein
LAVEPSGDLFGCILSEFSEKEQDGADTPYPEQAFRNQTTVGNVMSTQSGIENFEISANIH